MCERPKTSKEHVPPKCIFPEKKDLKIGLDFKKNLITVPSCDIHNSGKSKDDEYFMFILASGLLGNEYKDGQVDTKIMRAIERSPHVYTSFLKEFRPAFLKKPDGKVEESAYFKVDLDRFEGIAHHMARGIFFYHYGKKWLGGYSFFSNMLIDLNSKNAEEVNSDVLRVVEYASLLFKDHMEYGANKEIFKYKIVSESENYHGVHMIFFEGVEITVLLKNV